MRTTAGSSSPSAATAASTSRSARRATCARRRARCTPPSRDSTSPADGRGIFMAEHGSWNRSTPIGYRVTFVKIDGGRATSYEPFATGWLKGGTASGRPADVLVMSDGALLVSDDKAGRIYRISYAGGR